MVGGEGISGEVQTARVAGGGGGETTMDFIILTVSRKHPIFGLRHETEVFWDESILKQYEVFHQIKQRKPLALPSLEEFNSQNTWPLYFVRNFSVFSSRILCLHICLRFFSPSNLFYVQFVQTIYFASPR